MIYFIANTTSKTGRAGRIWNRVKTILKIENIEYKAYRTKGKGHATFLASRLTKDLTEDITLVVLGGDGTINEVINGIETFNYVKLGVIPTGSGNDFARGMGLIKDPEENLINILNDFNERYIDLGRVKTVNGERYFAISAGLGMDAIVCKKAFTSKQKKFLNRIHLGKLTYLLLTVETLFSMKTGEATVIFDGVKYDYDRLVFMAGMNLSAEGGGVPMAPSASCHDGNLSMCVAHSLTKAGAFLRLPLLVMAKHERLKEFHVINFENAAISIAEPMVLHTDGEYCGEFSRIKMECVKNAIRIVG